MRVKKKNMWQISCALLLTSIIFLLYLVLIPPTYDLFGGLASSKSLSDNKKIPIRQTKKASFIITIFTENEFLTDLVSSHIVNRSFKDYRQLLKITLYTIAVLLTSLGVSNNYKTCFVWEKDRRTSVLARSKGGHAPPMICI